MLDGVKATFLKTPYIITENLKKIFFHQKKEKKKGGGKSLEVGGSTEARARIFTPAKLKVGVF